MIKKIVSQLMGSNVYVVCNEENRQAVIIDSGEGGMDLYNTVKGMGYIPVALLLTHGHFDHAGGAKELQDAGVKVYIHELDFPMTENGNDMSSGFGFPFKKFTADVSLKEGELSVAGFNFKVLHTPGHTIGSVCYILDDVIFSGDTLFRLSYGRYDLPTGNGMALMDSLKAKLFALCGDYIVYTGHGEDTKLSFERAHNPCLEDWYD